MSNSTNATTTGAPATTPSDGMHPLPAHKEKEVAVIVDTNVTVANRNDDSNPQQGTGTTSGASAKSTPPPVTPTTTPQRLVAQRPSLKIPPTAKDERKLFVGGLPADGK